jgi:small-conductance mechanosensitive channel
MTDYQKALKAATELVRRWCELFASEQQMLASGDRETVLDALTQKHSLPAQVHRAVLQAAQAAAQWYAQLANDEEQRIAELDAKLRPLLHELEQIRQRVDGLVRERRGREHRLTVLQTCQRSAAQLTTLAADRVRTPEDAFGVLSRLPPCEVPPPPEPFQRMAER